MDKSTNFPHQETKPPPPPAEAEEEEEAISLCDFPLNSDEPPEKKESPKIQDKRRSSSEPSEFFEFFHDFTSEMSNAEDIIFCGKLMPYKNPPRILKSLSADDATRFYRRSLPAAAAAARRSRLPRSGSGRSMDSRRLIVKPAAAADIHRSSSKSSVKSEGSKAAAAVKPRWFVMMFGPLKLQPEMDLRDIKNRQVRRNPGSLFGGNHGGRSDRRSFWGLDLLKVLSCKNHASVAVTTSIGLVPNIVST